MSLEEMIGQMILVGFPGTHLTDESKKILTENKIGNVILFADNIESASQLSELTSQIQEVVKAATGYPAFIGIDQEGGVVTRLSKDIPQIPGAMAIAATDDPELAYKAGRMTGEQLSLLGVNMDFAPDMDVNSNRKNPVIGVRSYGETPEQVIRFALPASKGLEDGGVASCAKHFPGHGDTDVDSHLGLPVVDKSIEELAELELRPFEAAVRAGIASIMTTHIVFPQIDKDYPATMSKRVLTGILREKLGYEGVVVTDCLEMGAIKEHYGSANGAVFAAAAGADILCFSHTAEYAVTAIGLIKAAVESGEIPISRIEEASGRVIKLKERFPGDRKDLGLLKDKLSEYKIFTDELRGRSITVIENKENKSLVLDEGTVVLGCNAYRSTLVSSNPLSFNFAEHIGEALSLPWKITPLRPTDEEIDSILEEAKKSKRVVLGTYNAHILPEQMKLVRTLSENISDLIIVALRNPYDLYFDGPGVKLAAYEYTEPVFDELVKVFRGEKTATGLGPR